MAMIDTRGEYDRAYNLYLIAQAECPHWDYENPDGEHGQCCLEMEQARQRCKQVKARLSR